MCVCVYRETKRTLNSLSRILLQAESMLYPYRVPRDAAELGVILIHIHQTPCIACLNFSPWLDNPYWARTSLLLSFQDYTRIRTTVGRTPLYE